MSTTAVRFARLHGLAASAAAASALLAGLPAQAIVTTSAASNWEQADYSSTSLLDGVAKLTTNTGYGCSGSLLAGGAYILTAAHCVTDDNGALSVASLAITFANGLTASVSSAAQISVADGWTGTVDDGSDLALLQLDSVVSSIAGYAIYTGSTASLDSATVLLTGYGYTGTGTTGATTGTFGTLHWGYNEYESIYYGSESGYYVYDFDDGTSTHNGLAGRGTISSTGLGSDEAMIASGDSGGGSFIELAGVLYLVGVHSYGTTSSNPRADVLTGINSSYGDLGGDSLLTSATAQNFLSLATAVPEPATAALWLAGLAGMAGLRRRTA